MRSPTTAKLRKKKEVISVTIKDDDGIDLKFNIRPLSTFEIAEHSDVFTDVPKDLDLNKDPKDLDQKQQLVLGSKVLIPMIKQFVPICVVNPIVTTDDNDPRLKDPECDIIHLRDIPINVAGQLFNEILASSGLGKEADEARKKLPTSS